MCAYALHDYVYAYDCVTCMCVRILEGKYIIPSPFFLTFTQACDHIPIIPLPFISLCIFIRIKTISKVEKQWFYLKNRKNYNIFQPETPHFKINVCILNSYKANQYLKVHQIQSSPKEKNISEKEKFIQKTLPPWNV